VRPRLLAALLALLPHCAARAPSPVTEPHAAPATPPVRPLEDEPVGMLPDGVQPTRYALTRAEVPTDGGPAPSPTPRRSSR
jgi:hypothetical protein